MPSNQMNDLLNTMKEVMIASVAGDTPDLTSRGLAILLVLKTVPGPHTVRGMAKDFGVPKPSITRTMDRLEDLGLARRIPDPSDARSVILLATQAGAEYVTELGRLARKVALSSSRKAARQKSR